MQPIDNILFDWSGTLVDDLPPVVDATNVVLAHCGRPALSRDEFLREFELPFGKFYARLLPGIPLESLEPVFHEAFARSEHKATPLPHATEFLEFCRRTGRRCFVLSSAHPSHLAAQADEFAMTPFFEHIYAGVRDKTERIHQILLDHALDPAATAFVGDMTHDVETARHGGVRSVAVLTGYQSAATLSAVDPDVLVRNLSHLGALMRGQDPLETMPVGAVGALLLDAGGRVLLLRSDLWNNRWGIPGGKIKRGETSEAALRREITEETGLTLDDPAFIMVQDCVEPVEFHRSAHFLLLCYVARARPGRVTLNHEAQEFRWVPPERALEMELTIPTRRLLVEILQRNAWEPPLSHAR
jgi:phosphoglycolate phosphatase-like HAD superfamily hydrolase/ADP-ribose pyrophosphatase YjhB (NUDIX family)